MLVSRSVFLVLLVFLSASSMPCRGEFVPFAQPLVVARPSGKAHHISYSIGDAFDLDGHLDQVLHSGSSRFPPRSASEHSFESTISDVVTKESSRATQPLESRSVHNVTSQFFGLDFQDASKSPPRASGSPGLNHYGHMDRELIVWYDIDDPHDEQFRLESGEMLSIFEEVFGPSAPCAASNAFDSAAPRIFYDHFDDRWVVFYASGARDTSLHSVLCIALSDPGDTVDSFQLDRWSTMQVDLSLTLNTTGNITGLEFGLYSDLTLIGLHKEADAMSFGLEFYSTANSTTDDWVYFGSFIMAVQLSSLAQATPLFTDFGDAPASFNQWAPVDVDGPRPVDDQLITFIRVDYWTFTSANEEISTLEVWVLSVPWESPGDASGGLSDLITLESVRSAPTPSVVPLPDDSGIVLYHTSIFGHRVVYRTFDEPLSGDIGEHILGAFQALSSDGILSIAWVELSRLDPSEPWGLERQGVLEHPDGEHLFNPSICSNIEGTKVVGYSMASSQLEPSIGYETVPKGEPRVLFNGNGHEPGVTLSWMVFTSMDVEPEGDTRFFYLNMQYTESLVDRWQYVITSFDADDPSDDDDDDGGARIAGIVIALAFMLAMACIFVVTMMIVCGLGVFLVAYSIVRQKSEKKDPFDYDEQWDDTDSSGEDGGMHEL